MSTKLIEELKELKEREGVFFGTDKNLKTMQYEKAKNLMIDIQIADIQSEYYKCGIRDTEEVNFIIEDQKGMLTINHDRKDYFLILD